MAGTPVIGGVVAQLAFWVILARGVVGGELRPALALVFVALWIAGALGIPRISPFAGPVVTSFVAVLDIVLVFAVFKGDVPLT
jgi:hypothetical protein